MAVKLNDLYQEIVPEHEVHLLTTDCFEKKIEWVHMVENIDFISLLHGDELVFNSNLDGEDEEYRKKFIEQLIEGNAGGLIVALQEGKSFSPELIEYCNSLEFPVFQASWNTSYLDIMRLFSEILLSNERKEMNLIAAVKNAIFYPADEELYLSTFERNGFFKDMIYNVVVLGVEEANSVKNFEKEISRITKKGVFFENKGNLLVLCADCSCDYLKEQFKALCEKYTGVFVGVGTEEKCISDICRSYKNAHVAFSLAKRFQYNFPCCYDNIGIYQILSNIREPERLYPKFVQDTLGALIEHDKKRRTNYMEVLKLFFQNDCSITQTANATFYHQNTLKYKVKAIKEILGYDIMSNENRVKIMVSLYLLDAGENFLDVF